MVVFGQRGCIRAKVDVFVKSGCIQENGSFRANVVFFGQSGYTRVKWLYSGKRSCIRAKVVLLWQMFLYSGKVVLFGEKWL